ncbi:VTT domain-containing protein [Aquipuribacter sp. MA13-6]|uniref:VTT domain-containing protein n=1 Tax=unclassified Aquipuribacter TaxID=2635084 RepID=UPI003EEE0792
MSDTVGAAPGAGPAGRPPADRRRARRRALLAVGAVVALNVATYAVLATDTAQRWIASVEQWAYLGSFVLALLTNATLAVPVPYNPVVIQLMVAVEHPMIIAVLAAAGASLGESTGWWVGSQGRAVLPTEGRAGAFVARLHRLSAHRAAAFWGLVVFSAVPNPAFDVAGLVAGAARVPYLVFLGAAFLGRLIRFTLFALFGAALLDLWPF